MILRHTHVVHRFGHYAPPYRILAKRWAASPAVGAATNLQDQARQALTALTEERRAAPLFAGPDFVPETLPAGWRPIARQSPLRILSTYRALSKERLSILMVLTAMAGYAICPGVSEAATSAATVGPMLPAPSLLGPLAASSVPHSPLVTLLSLTAGTYLLSASTNAINQIVEAPLDAQMPRTLGRPLPRRLISTLHASLFAASTGVLGVGTLFYLTSPLVAFLGFTNHVLYAFVYTPSKRRTVFNTPIGALVGAIPPLMGWAAASGTLLEASDAPGWALAGILFAWQYPHFNALAYSLRTQYAQAGYRMLVSISPRANARSALRGSIGIAALCAAMPLYICPELFAGDAFFYGSLLLNSALVWMTARFWLACRATSTSEESTREKERTAKQLFYASLAHLPTLLILLMLCKAGTIEDLQNAWTVMLGGEAVKVKPAAARRTGLTRTSVFTEHIPEEDDDDLTELSGTEYVRIGGLADADESLASKTPRSRLLAPPPRRLEAHSEGHSDSLNEWQRRAASERLV